MKNLKTQSQSQILINLSQEKHKIIDKRGRKTKNLTIILSNFLSKSRKDPPRNEFLRCSLLSKMLKMIRSVLKNKASIFLSPSYALFCIIVKTNSDYILEKIENKNLDLNKNKKNLIYKSFSNKFCEVFFSDLLIRQLFEVFIDFVFTDYTLKELQKYIGVYCCEKNCIDESLCRLKYIWLKGAILEDFLR